jgi:hypothetical protein
MAQEKNKTQLMLHRKLVSPISGNSRRLHFWSELFGAAPSGSSRASPAGASFFAVAVAQLSFRSFRIRAIGQAPSALTLSVKNTIG